MLRIHVTAVWVLVPCLHDIRTGRDKCCSVGIDFFCQQVALWGTWSFHFCTEKAFHQA